MVSDFRTFAGRDGGSSTSAAGFVFVRPWRTASWHAWLRYSQVRSIVLVVAAHRHLPEQPLDAPSGDAVDDQLADPRTNVVVEEEAGRGDGVGRLHPHVAGTAARRGVGATGLEPGVEHLGEVGLPPVAGLGRPVVGPEGEQGVEVALGVGPADALHLAPGASGNRTHAIQRCADSLQRTLGPFDVAIGHNGFVQLATSRWMVRRQEPNMASELRLRSGR